MLVTLRELLPQARRAQYAVGLFNTVNLEMAMGVLAAAEEARAPVIIGTAEILLPYAPLEVLAGLLLPMARRATVPVAVHFDHGLTVENTIKAMELGFSSVMFDASTLPVEENIQAVRAMTERAHGRGVSVEAELGHVGDAQLQDAGEDCFTQPEEAARFAEATGVDALAVAFGTAHGAYKRQPRLDFDRLAQIARITPTPLVMHGGSGLSEPDFKRAVAEGVTKINIFTDINCACEKAAAEGYRPGMGMTDRMQAMVEAVRLATLEKMRIFGCLGRA